MIDALTISVYFKFILITNLSGIETLICHGKTEFNRVYFLRFCTKYDTLFSKYRIELIVALSSKMPQKKKTRYK